MGFDINNLNFLNYTANSVQLLLGLIMLLFNILIGYIIWAKCNLKSTEIRLIMILCCVEITNGVELSMQSIEKFINGYHWFDAGTIACQTYGFITQFLLRTEPIVVLILALCRYLNVVHGIEKSFRFWVTILLCFASPITGIHLYGTIFQVAKPTPSYISCQPFLYSDIVSFILTIIETLLYAIPCWITTYCYMIIGWNVTKRLNIMIKEAEISGSTILCKMIRKKRNVLFFQLLMVFIIYNVCFMPAYVTYIMRLSIGYRRTPVVDALVFILCNISLTANPVVTVIFQPDVNNEIKAFVVKFRARRTNVNNRNRNGNRNGNRNRNRNRNRSAVIYS